MRYLFFAVFIFTNTSVAQDAPRGVDRSGALGEPAIEAELPPRDPPPPSIPPACALVSPDTAAVSPTNLLRCGADSCFVDFKENSGPDLRPEIREQLKKALARDNTTVRLGPNVELDFSDLPASFFPIQFGRCVTLTSVSSFEPGPSPAGPRGRGVMEPPVGRSDAAERGDRSSAVSAPSATSARLTARRGADAVGDIGDLEVERAPRLGAARTPKSLGPLLIYGPSRDPKASFLEIICFENGKLNDRARISGFRLRGPSLGNQSTKEVGIRILDCIDIEISNMEIFGWGGAGISINGDYAGGRILNVGQIKIFNNFFHHNQHPSQGGSAAGYGIDVSVRGWARISENVFDFNRHAIATHGKSGGYDAVRNLVLKGGGFHGRYPVYGDRYTHQFDVHGTDNCGFSGFFSDSVWNCGNAGKKFEYVGNSFQYTRDNAIKIRGKPAEKAYIAYNVFPHEGLENDWGDDAINLHTSENVEIGPGNVIEVDTFGEYGVCDFDGDGVDDLFLATGATWWYSSSGEFHWSYMNAKKERLSQVRLGYFDNDLRCDVLVESGGRWMISSGGYGDWQGFGAFGAPLSEVEFGWFDPNVRDHRPNATRRATHAFRRWPAGQWSDGEWSVTPLSASEWSAPVQNSSLPMNELKFGDFTGDGVTDVLAVIGGRWQISESALNPWTDNFNTNLDDAVESLFIADIDNDNIDDILKLVPMVATEEPCTEETEEDRSYCLMTIDRGWRVSWGGRTKWQPLQPEVVVQVKDRQDFEFEPKAAFVGRFGAARPAGILVVDPDRIGRFFSPAESEPEWSSLFPY